MRLRTRLRTRLRLCKALQLEPPPPSLPDLLQLVS